MIKYNSRLTNAKSSTPLENNPDAVFTHESHRPHDRERKRIVVLYLNEFEKKASPSRITSKLLLVVYVFGPGIF